MPRPRTKFAWQAPHEGSHLQFAAAVEFSRKLRRLMARKGFSQSDLARECWGEEETKDGYMAARGRDKINKYCAGKTIPDADTLVLLARALEVPESELAPVVVGTAAERENPEVRMTVIAGHRELVHMSWNTVMPLHVALQMLALYQMTETRGPTGQEMAAQAQPYNTTDARIAEAMTAAARALATNLEVAREKVGEDRETINQPEAEARFETVTGGGIRPVAPRAQHAPSSSRASRRTVSTASIRGG